MAFLKDAIKIDFPFLSGTCLEEGGDLRFQTFRKKIFQNRMLIITVPELQKNIKTRIRGGGWGGGLKEELTLIVDKSSNLSPFGMSAIHVGISCTECDEMNS